MMSYVGDVVMPFKVKGDKAMGSFITRPGHKILKSEAAYADAVKEAMLLWSPLFGSSLPKWAEGRKMKDKGAAAQMKGRTHVLNMHINDALASLPAPPAPARSAMHVTQEMKTKAKVVKSVLHNQQMTDAQRRMAMEGVQSILITKSSLKRLLRKELALKEQSKDTFRR